MSVWSFSEELKQTFTSPVHNSQDIQFNLKQKQSIHKMLNFQNEVQQQTNDHNLTSQQEVIFGKIGE